ncbi:MAG: protein phosphatase 2C domain-containing protein, partial [Actinomycetota bacterium]
MIRVVAGAATHVGRVREANEDSFLCANGLYFVADGMGGHSAGEVASDIAVTTLREVLSEAGNIVLASDDVAAAVRHANTAIHSESILDSSKAGMGTTLTGLAVSNPFDHKAVVANVGDSRTYLWRHGELRQVTKDHSHVQSLVDRGAITRAEARVHFQRNIVLRAMGIDTSVDVDTFDIDLEDDDRFIICSDGLVDEADDDEIEGQIRQATDPQDLADRLVALANT